MVGVGGMGRVYCAEQVALGRTVAVKVVHPHLADDDMAAARFLNEARAASRLSHPNCVAIFDFGRTEEGQPYIVMEYVRGRDLGRIADTEGPLPLHRIVDVLRQTLAALEEAHALGIIHRDLKPDNIVLEPMRSGTDFVKVVDFGLAKFLGADTPAVGAGGALTRPGLVCGTPEYMSPEQGRGDALDGRADIYSVGVVLFELLAGRVPFAAETATRTLLLHLEEPAPDPRNIAPERSIPARFADLTRRALAKSADGRFQTTRAFSDALLDALFAAEGRLPQETTPATAIRCRSCGKLNPIGKKFCGECGTAIAISAAVSSLPPSARSPLPRAEPLAEPHAPTQLDQPQVSTRSHLLPLLGRDDAIAWLEGRRHDAEAMLAAAHIVGEAGMGKTRLLREFLGRCTGRGDFIVCVGPDPAWAKLGDSAVRDAIRTLAGLEGDRFEADAFASAPPDALRGLTVLFAEGGLALAASERRRALAEALRWAIERACERAGGAMVVLAVDDLDFVDGTSRNAFADVLSEPPVSSALLVVTYAPTSTPAGEPLAGETWPLRPLSHAEYGHLLPARVASPARLLVPLHVEQLIAWTREETEPPPERLADLLARRAEHLPTEARHALYAMAVWGDDATADILAGMLPGVDISSALDLLDTARLVDIDERCVRISQPLVRRVAFSSIPAGRKRELFSRTEELRPDAPLEIRAKRAMHGGSAFEALSLLDALSTRRAAHGDFDGSVSALRHALDIARRELRRDELDDPLSAVLVFARKLAEALASGEHWTDAEGVLREALGLAPPNSDHRVRLLGVLARVASARKHVQEARRYLDEAMRVARESHARELLPMLERLERLIAVA
jgi:serine/threonine-protein kinase